MIRIVVTFYNMVIATFYVSISSTLSALIVCCVSLVAGDNIDRLTFRTYYMLSLFGDIL